MKMLMLMLLLSINFMFMKHPLSVGFILLMQTIFSSLTCSLNLSSYFLSYILFLIFIGGMLILFTYMSSIVSNEIFFSMKLMWLNILLFTTMMMFNIMNFSNQNMLINFYNEYHNYFSNKLYMLPSGNIALMMVIYLLFTLIIVSNIIKSNNLPLRSN